MTKVDDIEIIYDNLSEDQKIVYDCIGGEAFMKLVQLVNGDSIYIPSADTVSRPVRNAKIIEEYNGYNHRALAKKFGINERTVREIVKDHVIEKRNKPLEGQVSFDKLPWRK